VIGRFCGRDFDQDSAVEGPAGFGIRSHYPGVVVRRFGYVFDPLFLVCCALYAVNRWLIKPHCHIVFFHSWFNDILLIPCALPPLLLVRLGFVLRQRHLFEWGLLHADLWVLI
jgi:hypothetical protein